MTADKPSNLAPKLRFPEFLSGSTWDELAIGDVCDLKAGDFIPASEIAEHADEGSFPCYGGNGFRGYVESFTHEGRYVLVGRQGALCGNVNLYAGKFHATEHALVATPKPGIDTGWLFYALDVLTLNRFSIGQAQPGLSIGVLRDVGISVPIGEDEQQKIADCLGSLDDLIAVEGRKLEALRQHKQGLMQQLFPQLGQSRPRLRFPQFRNAVEWQRCALGKIAEISKGKGISKSDVVQRGRTPCVRYGELYTSYGEIIENVKSRTNLPTSDLVLSNAGDVIIPASGETKEDIATCACVVDDGVALGSDLNVIRSPVDGRFFSYYLNGSRRRELAKVAQGDTVAHLYPTQLSRLDVYIPAAKAEQQRIADCLSSLDARLAAQVQKLNALKTHKQGLLQQIFPSLERH